MKKEKDENQWLRDGVAAILVVVFLVSGGILIDLGFYLSGVILLFFGVSAMCSFNED